MISDYVWWFYIVISKKIPIVCASSLAVFSWVEQAFSFTCHICWALKLVGCFWNMEIGENTAAVSIQKRRYLGVGCIYAFYWNISCSNFVNVKLQLECWTASLNMAGQKISPYSWHSRKLCHLIKKKKKRAENLRHIMFSEETTLFQSSKKNSKEIVFFLKR